MAESSRAIVVVDLGFGDSGKGAIVDALTRQYRAHTVVRYNGGAQAAHTVVLPDGRSHTFSQWGSGTFVSGVRTYLSEYMIIDPLALLREEEHLQTVGITDGFSRLFIDERALVVTPFARAINRLREVARGAGRHGSCGMGIGETVVYGETHNADAIRVCDFLDETVLRNKLMLQRERMCEIANGLALGEGLSEEMQLEQELLKQKNSHAVEHMIRAARIVKDKAGIVGTTWAYKLFDTTGVVIFEGAQGVLLDKDFGFQPYTTWSDTTSRNAVKILQTYSYKGSSSILGVLRAYATRHGNGPLVSESKQLSQKIPDVHNIRNDWQENFRVGWFDAVAIRYALKVNGGVDSIALTNLDRIIECKQQRIVTAYQSNNDMLVSQFGEQITSGGIFKNIQFVAPAQYRHQELLTNFLFGVNPRYASFTTSKEQGEIGDFFIKQIESALGVVVSIVGYGPTYEQKLWRSELF